MAKEYVFEPIEPCECCKGNPEAKEYFVWVDKVITKKVWFTADSITEAEDLIHQIEEGELALNELPNFEYKVMADSISFGFVEEDN